MSESLTLLLRALSQSEVNFILVGGLAAVTQGAPLTTFDVDIVHERSEENVSRLVDFLNSIHARYRGRPVSSPLGPSKEALLTEGHSLFMTDLGPLDALGSIEDGKSYDDLISFCICLDLGSSQLNVLELEKLIELKRNSKHPKDLQKLSVLEETLKQLCSKE